MEFCFFGPYGPGLVWAARAVKKISAILLKYPTIERVFFSILLWAKQVQNLKFTKIGQNRLRMVFSNLSVHTEGSLNAGLGI